MNIVMMGAQGTGKGTVAGILKQELNIPHISTGEIFRKNIKEGTELGKIATKYADEGKLVPDEVTNKMVKARINEEDCKNGFILDGYPRTLNQIHLLNNLLDEMGRKIDKVIELTAPDELVFKRILERKSCQNCGRMYGIDFPSKVEDICDDCGSHLEVRTDDTKETLQARIDTYKNNSKEILDYYRNVGLLKTVDSSAHPEEIVEQATEE